MHLIYKNECQDLFMRYRQVNIIYSRTIVPFLLMCAVMMIIILIIICIQRLFIQITKFFKNERTTKFIKKIITLFYSEKK